jgi:hypothetical protein
VAILCIFIINGGYVMDINGLLLGWSIIATCAIGYYQWKAGVYQTKAKRERYQRKYYSFLLCEVASGDVQVQQNGNKYTIAIEGLPEFSFERKN